MQKFGIAGWQNSGKTTLVKNLIPTFAKKGLTVSTIKHAHHNFDIDKPGKDSYEHRRAGAKEVLISSKHRWALIHEKGDKNEPNLHELLSKLKPVDLVLIEGFKKENHSKLEVHRGKLGKELICQTDPKICMVVSDIKLSGLDIPVFDISDYTAISEFIIEFLKLKVT
ncbi:MAG: molybdopterin-guanine dinucleotide biosynthesis protein B [Pseudomonadota bacterium]|nr:molybdopterin-guanine dinucleotide biosynthesis protein B [Pseudomonadota bacterium]|tara:strand:+ start:119 stop:622 length:504 start_codon:yes stop_codon:yes gene_type:complete